MEATMWECVQFAAGPRARTAERLSRFAVDGRGNVAITAAIAITLLAGVAGGAVAYSSASSTRTNLQTALDSAVLAGVIASENGQDPIATANNVFQSNLNSFAQASTTAINAVFTMNDPVLTGNASGSVKNPFGDIIGGKIINVNVTAAATKQTTPICVLGLDGLDKGSFDINGSKAVFNANCAVQANTTSTSGMTMEGSPTANAKKFGVSGGHKGDGFSPPPADGSPKVADPYASLPFPYYSACPKNSSMQEIKVSQTLPQGTYCGGVHIYGDGTNVTLQQGGVFVMVDGPFRVDGNAAVTGDQVMIAFTGKGATLQLWGGSSMTVTSPISGTYMNMQFMQDNTSTDTHGLWVSLGGSDTDSAKLSYDGVAYFPTQNFWVRGSSTVNANSPSMAIVADKIWTQGSATVNVTNNNPRNLSVFAPQMSYGARLIQ
jgi:Flp pilus assembly protein TadG